MNKATLLTEIMQLTPEDRRDLLQELSAAVSEDEEFALTEEQIAECERRVAEHERHPERAIPWEVVRERLWSRYIMSFRLVIEPEAEVKSLKPRIGMRIRLRRFELDFSKRCMRRSRTSGPIRISIRSSAGAFAGPC
jgi:putative addiction module component (TIGR02574 family)